MPPLRKRRRATPCFGTFLPLIGQKKPSNQSFSAFHACASSPSCSEYDVVVIGSGIGGLSAAALLSASYNRKVCVLESHTVPGGAAHAFTRRTSRGTFTFDAGPHLFSGLSSSGSMSATPQFPIASPPSANPMQHVLRAVGANLPVMSYKRWGVFLPGNVYIPTTVSPSKPLFSELISAVSGAEAAKQVAQLLNAMQPLCRVATALPPAALRAGDVLGSIRVASRFLARTDLLSSLPNVSALTAPFEPLLHRYVKDEFARNFLNLLCFLLAGVTADKIPTAEVAFMFSEWMGTTAGDMISDSVLEHPKGGGAGIANALVEAIERNGHSKVRTKCHVSRILIENDSGKGGKRAVGVQLKSGEKIYAKEGVISNVSAWDLPNLLAEDGVNKRLPKPPPKCPSFMHLHVAVELTAEVREKIPYALEANYALIEDWNRGVSAEDNVVLVSIPSVLEANRAPEGFAVLHAYTPATEHYEAWEGLQEGSEEYERLKQERSEVLWRAVGRIFGQDVRDIAHVKLVGTPKTHEKYLRRRYGTYGPEVDASKSFLTLPFQQRKETAGRLWTVGDSTFPGIGVPATAASGWLAANGLVDVWEHEALLRKIGL